MGNGVSVAKRRRSQRANSPSPEEGSAPPPAKARTFFPPVAINEAESTPDLRIFSENSPVAAYGEGCECLQPDERFEQVIIRHSVANLSHLRRTDCRCCVMRTNTQVYTVGRRLGSGAFSVVHTCVHKKTGAEFAVKIVDR
jgi:hypothetical protein